MIANDAYVLAAVLKADEILVKDPSGVAPWMHDMALLPQRQFRNYNLRPALWCYAVDTCIYNLSPRDAATGHLSVVSETVVCQSLLLYYPSSYIVTPSI
jgi:hypothetical protein